jgi:hypothetical protein
MLTSLIYAGELALATAGANWGELSFIEPLSSGYSVRNDFLFS